MSRIIIPLTIGAVTAIIVVLALVVIPLTQPHDPETIAWINQASCEELADWIESKRWTLAKYQSTAKNIYQYNGCGELP